MGSPTLQSYFDHCSKAV